MFVREDADRFRRFTETHYQRGYTVEKIRELVERSGMVLIELLDADFSMLPIMTPALKRRPSAAVTTGLVLCISLALSTNSLVD